MSELREAKSAGWAEADAEVSAERLRRTLSAGGGALGAKRFQALQQGRQSQRFLRLLTHLALQTPKLVWATAYGLGEHTQKSQSRILAVLARSGAARSARAAYKSELQVGLVSCFNVTWTPSGWISDFPFKKQSKKEFSGLGLLPPIWTSLANGEHNIRNLLSEHGLEPFCLPKPLICLKLRAPLLYRRSRACATKLSSRTRGSPKGGPLF